MKRSIVHCRGFAGKKCRRFGRPRKLAESVCQMRRSRHLPHPSSENISINAVCPDLERSASGNRIPAVLNEQLNAEQLYQHEQQINEALTPRLPQQLRTRCEEAAIDEHDEPCYAKTPELRACTCRSKRRAGTSHFVRPEEKNERSGKL